MLPVTAPTITSIVARCLTFRQGLQGVAHCRVEGVQQYVCDTPVGNWSCLVDGKHAPEWAHRCFSRIATCPAASRGARLALAGRRSRDAEEVVGPEKTDRNASDCRNHSQSLLAVDESGLRVLACRAEPLDLGTARDEDVRHPVGVRAVQQRNDETILGAEGPHRGRIVSSSHAAPVADDRKRRQPARNQSHDRVRDLAIEPSERSRDRHKSMLRTVDEFQHHPVLAAAAS